MSRWAFQILASGLALAQRMILMAAGSAVAPALDSKGLELKGASPPPPPPPHTPEVRSDPGSKGHSALERPLSSKVKLGGGSVGVQGLAQVGSAGHLRARLRLLKVPGG